MKSFFTEIFKYHHKVNLEILDEIEKHFDALLAKTFLLFCHNLNAPQIWNLRITENSSFGIFDEYPLEKARLVENENFERTIRILDKRKLEEVIHYINTKGESLEDNIRDILFHVGNHHTHHRGQIIADFRASGIPPLVTDYICQRKR